MKVKLYYMMVLGLLSLAACKSDPEKEASAPEKSETIPFDKLNWQVRDGVDYVYRDKMLASLLASDTLKKLNRNEILSLLGEPDRTDNHYLFYTVAQQRMQVLTLHTKTLVIKLAENPSENKVMIHE